jgi:hypothetical protein
MIGVEPDTAAGAAIGDGTATAPGADVGAETETAVVATICVRLGRTRATGPGRAFGKGLVTVLETASGSGVWTTSGVALGAVSVTTLLAAFGVVIGWEFGSALDHACVAVFTTGLGTPGIVCDTGNIATICGASGPFCAGTKGTLDDLAAAGHAVFDEICEDPIDSVSRTAGPECISCFGGSTDPPVDSCIGMVVRLINDGCGLGKICCCPCGVGTGVRTGRTWGVVIGSFVSSHALLCRCVALALAS